MHRRTDRTVSADLLAPLVDGLARARGAHTRARPLSMTDFIALGVLRHLQGTITLREQVRALLHLDPGATACVPLARSTWSDA